MHRSASQAEALFPLAQFYPPHVTFRNTLPDETAVRLALEASANARNKLAPWASPSSVVLSRGASEWSVDVTLVTRDGPCRLSAQARSLQRALARAFEQIPSRVRRPGRRPSQAAEGRAA